MMYVKIHDMLLNVNVQTDKEALRRRKNDDFRKFPS